MKDKTKAYVVFSRPYNFMGAGNSIDIVQFNNKTFKPKYVAYLSAGERVIYAVNTGENYFFTDVGANENIQYVNAKSGQVYYINLGVTGEAIFFPKLYKERRLNFAEELKQENCSDEFLNKYLFKLEQEIEEEISYVKDKNPITKYDSIIQFKIECQNGKVIKIKDKYYVHTLSELKAVELVKPNEKAYQDFNREKEQYRKDIKAYYPTWDFKFKNVPMTESVFLDIKDNVKEKDFKKYTMVDVFPSSDNKLDDNTLQGLTKRLKSKFEYSDNGNILTIEYVINKLDTGNMFGRYMTMGIAKNSYRSNMGVIDVDIIFKDKDEAVVGSIRVSQLEAGGFLGGVNTLKSDVAESIYEYVKNNYLK